jgi:peptidoglycan/xylan/chitin deacetylase (PgdA/CDA1 family)
LYRHKSVSSFKTDLDILLKHFTPIGLLDFLDHVKRGRRLPERAFLLTFDDGFREMSDTVAPVLAAKGISATFFLNSAFIDNRQMCYLNKASLVVEALQQRRSRSLAEKVVRFLRSRGIPCDRAESGTLSITYQQRAVVDELAEIVELDFDEYLAKFQPYLTADQTKALIQRGFTFGAHSVDHPRYSALSLNAQLAQTTESLRRVQEAFQLTYGAFAFPHSDDKVSREFFDTLGRSGLLDVSFGTAGMVSDSAPNHFQRFSLESPAETADRIIAFQLFRRLSRKMTGSATIAR